jgi:hypothetical protein
MRYLRWMTFAAGLAFMAFAVVNVHSVVELGPVQEGGDELLSWSSQTVTWNLLPLLIGLVGFGLVSFALVWTRASRQSTANQR